MNLYSTLEIQKHNSVYDWSYLMAAVIKVSLLKGRNIDKIREVFDNDVIPDTTFHSNKCFLGIAALDLYRYTKDKKYLDYAKWMYETMTKTIDQVGGFLYIPNESVQMVDGIGLACPFLMYYGRETNNQEAINTAVFTINQFVKYGMDKETGVAAHGYTIYPPFLKVGGANWGRGNAWMALGLVSAKYKYESIDYKDVIEKFNNTISYIFRQNNGEMGVFIGEKESSPDLTTVIPLLYYMDTYDVLKISDDQKLKYSVYLKDGLLYSSSGTCSGLCSYSKYMGLNLLSTAVMLLWLNHITI